ncbi:MAG: hypothetical protein KDK23_06680 [Leptospiraceae bacterium]|nr:hypothetical protein [Leptospiraceae bacterium]
MSAAGQKLEFLNILKESEAIARGANLSEKAHHAVYKMVKSVSALDQIKNGTIFHAGMKIPELESLDYGRKEALEVLQRLISDQLIAQVFLLEFDGSANKLALTPCYIANWGDDRIGPEQLFQELLMQSVAAIEEFLQARPIFNRDQIWKDLEKDINSPATPDVSQLPASVVDPIAVIQPSAFDFVPPAEMLRVAKDEMREELIRRGDVVYLLEYGLLPVRDEELLIRFETCSDFMVSRIIPEHRNNANLKSELYSISTQEETYHLEGFVRKTADFTQKKAAALRKHLLAAYGKTSRFPGALAVEQVLKLQPAAEERYRQRWDQEMEHQHREIRDSILGLGVDVADQIRFFSEEDRQSIPADVWKKLINDSGFFHSTWERSDGTYHVLCKKNPGIFPELVNIMLKMGAEDHWKILAFRFLIEKYETTFPELFSNTDFVEAYGRLLRSAYMNLIPWYYRLLMFLGLKSFVDAAFQNAKKKIQDDQERLALKNQEKRDSQEKQKIMERKERSGQAETLEFRRRIVETLERHFYQNGTVPLISELMAEFPDRKPDEFKEFIKKQGFKLLDFNGDKIVLYPVDHQWRVRAVRLKKHLEQLVQDAGMEETRKARINTVLKMLQRSIKQAASGVGGQSTTEKLDPDAAFQRFETELEKHEKVSASAEEDPY